MADTFQELRFLPVPALLKVIADEVKAFEKTGTANFARMAAAARFRRAGRKTDPMPQLPAALVQGSDVALAFWRAYCVARKEFPDLPQLIAWKGKPNKAYKPTFERRFGSGAIMARGKKPEFSHMDPTAEEIED